MTTGVLDAQVRLVPAPPSVPPPPVLDERQAEAVAVRQGSGPLVLLGAPGTGKTTTLIEIVLARIDRDGVPPDEVLVLAPTRRAASALRERVAARLGRTVREPLARTPHSYAFGLLRRALVLDGDLPPRLISGPEQDRILADLLAGHAEGIGYAPTWPAAITDEIRTLRSFRGELRDLIMRAVERGLSPGELARLGHRHGRADWVAASDVYAEYLDVTSLATPGAFDPAGIVAAATRVLADDPALLSAERELRRLVVVEDAQELGTAGAQLARLLGGDGRDLVLAGDPDVATQGFRGARPRLLAEAAQRLRGPDGAPARQVVLATVHRHGPPLRAVAERITGRISTSGLIAHRTAQASTEITTEITTGITVAAPGMASVQTHLLASAAQEAAFIAQLLRRRHLDPADPLPWGSMAVVVRSVGATTTLRRALGAAGVPVSVPGTELPVRDEPAVVPLRLALRCVLDESALTAEVATELLTGLIGGADALTLRRLRQVLRARELAGGGVRSSDELLVELIAHPNHVLALQVEDEGGGDDPAAQHAAVPHTVIGPARRVATVLAAGRSALRAREASAETVLWAIWQTTGLAGMWRRMALGGGASGARADRDLDAVVALFDAAAAFVDRLPHARPEQFLEHLEGQDLPSDTLAERAPTDDAVTLITATGAAGRQWDLVVVAGVQEGSWPDLRLRSSLLGAQVLADLLDRGIEPAQGARPDRAEIEGQRRAVLDDELRLFLVACTRARRQLVVTAVRAEDLQPSPFLDLVEPPGGEGDSADGAEVRPLTDVPRAATLSALVAELRAVLLEPVTEADADSQTRRARAARHLARLAAAGVPGAAPRDWYGLAEVSTDAPLRSGEVAVRVSPSKVETFDRCPLRWLFDQAGGRRPMPVGVSVGTLVHDVAEAAPDGDLQLMRELLAMRWAALGLPEGWVGDVERAKAERMLEKLAEYVRQSRAAGRELVAVEQEISVQVGRADIRGSIDRLERDEQGRPVVIDLKTGRSKPSAAEIERHAQLGVYQLAVEHASGEDGGTSCGGAALVQLGGTTKAVGVQAQRPLAEDDDPTWAAALVERVAEGMAAGEFHATVNPRCRTCDLRRCCPAQLEGRQVTP
ncbi:MAG: ATP-dependent DNA helicase [Kineosporiaceae bacterium]